MSDLWPPLKLRGADPTMDYSSWPSSECSPRIMTALDHLGVIIRFLIGNYWAYGAQIQVVTRCPSRKVTSLVHTRTYKAFLQVVTRCPSREV